MVSDAPKHYPVLLNEIISIITPQHGGTFIDCTFGQGGYTKKILSYKDTQVIAIDRDIESKKIADKISEKFPNRFIFKHKKFSQLDNLKLKNEKIRGILLDFGYSFTQIKDPKKGLSFNSVGDLNMQMGLNNFSASDAINNLDVHELEKIFKFFGEELENIFEFDPLTGEKTNSLERVRVYANSHYVTPKPTMQQAMVGIKKELRKRLDNLVSEGKLLEAQRLEQRTNFDLEMLEATGVCNGIENYSRYLTGRAPGEPPPTLFEFIPDNAIVFADESHVSIPQIGGMYRGDYRRKFTLAEHGFRLPSCMDNRPLKFEEWDAMRPQSIYVSATPGGWELEQTGGVFTEQVIRPTGLLDPEVEIRPVEMQVDDLLDEVKRVAQSGFRTLVTTLTKRMAEDLTEYLNEQGVRVRYMHSDIDTIERIEILRDLRLGAFDVLVGINLLREGLDIPECGLVAILDADKEGFLRSETSLIQTIGRAARNENGKVIMYADRITGSMERAIAETDRRRAKQVQYNQENGITPETVKKNVDDILAGLYKGDTDQSRVTATIKKPLAGANLQTVLEGMRTDMRKAAENLEFEEAAKLRDEIQRLEAVDLAVADDPLARQSAIEAISNSDKPRSTAGRGGTRAYRGKSKPKLN